MSRALFLHIKKFTGIDEVAYETVESCFEPLRFRKKETVIRAGDRCNKLFFVLKGCMYSSFIDDGGTENTLQFAIEGWWITDFQAFRQQERTEYNIKAVGPCEVLCISYDNYQKLLASHPVMERYFRNVYEIGYGAVFNRLRYIFNYSKEDIYFRFREQFPEFVSRVPQYILATYLGLTPEYLSKLRSKKFS